MIYKSLFFLVYILIVFIDSAFAMDGEYKPLRVTFSLDRREFNDEQTDLSRAPPQTIKAYLHARKDFQQRMQEGSVTLGTQYISSPSSSSVKNQNDFTRFPESSSSDKEKPSVCFDELVNLSFTNRPLNDFLQEYVEKQEKKDLRSHSA